MGQQVEECGKVCTVRDVGIAVKNGASMVDAPDSEVLPEGFLKVQNDCGRDLMWSLTGSTRGILGIPKHPHFPETEIVLPQNAASPAMVPAG